MACTSRLLTLAPATLAMMLPASVAWAAPEAPPAPTAAASAPAPNAAAPAPAPTEAAPAPATPAAAPVEAASPDPGSPAPTVEAAGSPAPPTAPAEAAAAGSATPSEAAPASATVATAPSAATPAATPAAPPPEDPYTHVPFNIGLVPGLSINGTQRRKLHKPIRNTFSIAFGWSRAAELEGFAGALGATVIDERAEGVNWALGGNINRGEQQGLQIAYGFNLAQTVRGGQAATFNWAKEVRGAQLGMINTAGTVRGVQVGLVNYAEQADASIALLPITREGNVHPEVWTSDTAAINVGLRLPAKYTYTFFSGGLHPFGRRVREDRALQVGPELGRGKALELGLGFGGHIPVTDALFIDLDLGTHVVTNGLTARGPVAGLARLRLMLGWQVAKRFSLYGGPTLNAMFDDPAHPVDRPGYGWVSWSDTVGDGLEPGTDAARIRVWPGFAAGVRF